VVLAEHRVLDNPTLKGRFMFVRSTITSLAAVVALVGVADAGAASRVDDGGARTARPQAAKQARLTKAQGAMPERPVLTAGTTVMAISAHPTGGKGSGTEATCDLWSDRLSEDEDAVGQAESTQDRIDAVNALNDDIDNAMDAGCFVIYSMAKVSGLQLTSVKTISVARLATGGFTSSTWTAAPQVAKISAHPTGGKGSGTEATCKLWSQRLQEDEQINEEAQGDYQETLDKDVDNALDAGCFVIY
jgi:hypothetical protein